MRADRRLGANPISSSPAPNGRRARNLSQQQGGPDAACPSRQGAAGEQGNDRARASRVQGFYPLPKTQSPAFVAALGRSGPGHHEDCGPTCAKLSRPHSSEFNNCVTRMSALQASRGRWQASGRYVHVEWSPALPGAKLPATIICLTCPTASPSRKIEAALTAAALKFRSRQNAIRRSRRLLGWPCPPRIERG